MRKLIENKMLLGKIKALLSPTEDMSQRELSMALNKMVSKLNVNTDFDVPYLAGYSRDAKTIYIDQRVPKFLTHKGKRFNIHWFLILHEIIEKALIDYLGIHYNLAHEIASRAEYAAIIGENFSYRLYNRFIQEKLAEIQEKNNYYMPHDLDLKPYLDSKDTTLIKRIQQSLKIKWLNNNKLKINIKPKVIHQLIKPNSNFPNNSHLPLIIYQQALMLNTATIAEVKKFLLKNGWKNIWVDGVYPYHHYHSNTHEALVIFSGQCLLQVGGSKGKKFTIGTGDVIIFPAGVAHKKIRASADFKSIGCYPFAIDYDLKIVKTNGVEENIKMVDLPETDPIFGKKGLLLRYWRKNKNK